MVYKAIYSDSMVERETIPCRFEPQQIAESFLRMTIPEVDLAECSSPAQSASVYASIRPGIRSVGYFLYTKQMCFVCDRYPAR